MIATIASGAVHIISHPGNPKFPVDIPAIAAAAAKHHVALEINNSSFVSSRIGSEDNCRAVAAAVRDAGGWVALGSIPIRHSRLVNLANVAKSSMLLIFRKSEFLT